MKICLKMAFFEMNDNLGFERTYRKKQLTCC